MPRGGEGLISYVVKNSQIPIIKNDRGLCHVYIHEDADLDMAEQIVINAKTQRPGVCNSMETVLVHKDVSKTLIPRLFESMQKFGLQWFVDLPTKKILSQTLSSQDMKVVKNAALKKIGILSI